MWPTPILRQFAIATSTSPTNPPSRAFHAPYNKLLNTLFSPLSTFTVFPLPSPDSGALAFEVRLDDRPVLFLDVRNPSECTYASGRREADAEVRTWLYDIAHLCPLPTLYGISALGTKLCIYHLDLTAQPQARAVHPEGRSRSGVYEVDSAPREWSSLDVLDEHGEAEVRRIAEEIHAQAGCAALDAA